MNDFSINHVESDRTLWYTFMVFSRILFHSHFHCNKIILIVPIIVSMLMLYAISDIVLYEVTVAGLWCSRWGRWWVVL